MEHCQKNALYFAYLTKILQPYYNENLGKVVIRMNKKIEYDDNEMFILTRLVLRGFTGRLKGVLTGEFFELELGRAADDILRWFKKREAYNAKYSKKKGSE